MAVGAGLASRLNRRVRIERPVADSAFDAAGSGSWALVAETMAEVLDVLPGRGEALSGGINMAARPAIVIMRPRVDVTAAMRIVILRQQAGAWVPERVTQIVAGPTLKRATNEMQMRVEEYSSAGNAA